MFIESYGYRSDTGGLGKFRGGVGVGRAYRFLAPSIGICLVYKTKSPPWGVSGGGDGLPNQIVLNPGTDREVVQGGSYNHLDVGDVLVNNTGGGGGFGDPLDRDASAVLRDVRNGFVSLESARRDYRVVVNPADWTIDEPATTELRSSRP
jgi:N-methylhydantoinase B